MDRPRHCCASVAIGRMDGDVAMRVPLHDLAWRGPSAPDYTDGRTRGGNRAVVKVVMCSGGGLG